MIFCIFVVLLLIKYVGYYIGVGIKNTSFTFRCFVVIFSIFLLFCVLFCRKYIYLLFFICYLHLVFQVIILWVNVYFILVLV